MQASKEFSVKLPRFFELDEAAKLLFINENGCHNANWKIMREKERKNKVSISNTCRFYLYGISHGIIKVIVMFFPISGQNMGGNNFVE